ncbi:MAG: Ig-like domain-containing protein [Armatimonadetes bacterium]|nr:Ig-like domain-containing protein [Armatimonadota bacterium]
MSVIRTSPLLPPIAALALASAAGSAHAQVANTIQLIASRDTLRADGYSRAVITAEVRDGSGRIVPDGTEVRFSTTLGTIDPIATTEAGRARTNLISAASPGFASISATAGKTYREMRILFLSEGESKPERANVLPMEAEYIAYSSESRILEGTGRARVRMGSVNVLADRIQIDVDRTRIVAESLPSSPGLTITDGKTTWLARRLTYDWPGSQGIIEQEEGTFEYLGPPLALGKPTPGPLPANTFEMVDLEEQTVMWITAKRAALFPNQRIHFKSAEIRPGGKKILALPFQSMPLTASLGESEQFIGLGTQGVTLDVPYYVSLTDQSSTSFRLGWNQTQGSFGAVDPGLGLDLRHRIFSGERGEDTLNLSRITSKNWGAWYRHNRNWSPSLQTSGFVEFPEHRDLFAAGNAYFQAEQFTAALSASTFKPQGFNPSYVTDLSLESRRKPLGNTGLNYSLISSSGLSIGAGTRNYRQSLLVRATKPSWTWGERTTAMTTFSVGQVLAGHSKGLTADALINVNHRLGQRSYLGANYAYNQRPGYTNLMSKHRLGANLLLGGEKFNFFTTLSMSLDRPQTSIISSLDYDVSSRLRLGFRNIYFKYADLPYSDQEFSVTTPLLDRPFTVYWSRKRHRFVVEFAQLML